MYPSHMAAMEAEKAAASYKAGSAQTSIGGLGVDQNAFAPTTKEPSVSDRLKELRQYLYELTDVQGSLREVIVGPEVQEASWPYGNSTCTLVAREPSIEELVAECCQRAANLVGAARSLRNRL